MRALKWILLLGSTGLMVLFLLQNRGVLATPLPLELRLPLVTLRPTSPEGMRADLALALALAGGFALGYGLGVVRRVQATMEIRRLRRRVKDSLAMPPAANDAFERESESA